LTEWLTGCEYGDQVDWCKTYVQGPAECERPEVETLCCNTCRSHTETTQAPSKFNTLLR